MVRTTVAGITGVALLCTLSACGQTTTGIVGTWTGPCGHALVHSLPTNLTGGGAQRSSFTFSPSGQLSTEEPGPHSSGIETYQGSYTVTANKINLTEKDPRGTGRTQTGTFQITGNTLHLGWLVDSAPPTAPHLYCLLSRRMSP
ncbi:MAG: hypothetical protein ACRDSH_12660 [Pseudonocardiaceae bacterium]